MDVGNRSDSCCDSAGGLHADAGKSSLAHQSRTVRGNERSSFFLSLKTSRFPSLDTSSHHLLHTCLLYSRPEEARRVLQRIRGPCHDIDEELEAIKASADEAERELGVLIEP